MKKGLLSLACLVLLAVLPACRKGCGPCKREPECPPVCHKIRKPVYAEYEVCTSERKLGEVCDETDCRLVCDGKEVTNTYRKGSKGSDKVYRRKVNSNQYADDIVNAGDDMLK